MARGFGVAAGLDAEVARPLAARCAELSGCLSIPPSAISLISSTATPGCSGTMALRRACFLRRISASFATTRASQVERRASPR